MPDTLDPASIQADFEAAREHIQLGRPAVSLKSLRALQSRIDRHGDPRPEIQEISARVLVSQASALFDVRGDLDGSIALLDQAERIGAAVAGPRLVASVRGQRGLLFLRAGRTREALRALDDAATLLDEADSSDATFILINRGVLQLERGALSQAEADFQRCVELALASGDQTRLSVARHNLGYVDFLAGRLPRALTLIEEAGAPHPIALLDRARVLREAGLVEDADAILERAAAAFGAARLQQDLAETELARAECALVEGDATTGRRLAASAYRRFARRGNVRWQRKAELLLLRCERVAAERRPLGRRRRLLRETAGRAEQLALSCREEGRLDLARVAALLGQECRLLAGEEPVGAVPVMRRRDPLQLRLQAREVRALAALRRGDTARAAREVRRGLGELGVYQHSFGSLDLRTASAVHGAALARLGLDVALRTASPARVLNLVEHARAVSTRLPSVRPPGDELTAGLLSELRRVEEEIRGLEGDASAEANLARLGQRAAELADRIRARAWEREGERGEADDAPRCALVRDAARAADTAFATLARHQGSWLGVTVLGSRVRLRSLAPVDQVSALVQRVRADLDALAMPGLPEPLREAVRRSLDLGLHRLDGLVAAPLGVRDRPLVVSCSSDLLALPWGLLPSRLGVATVVAPSAATWLVGSGARRPAAPQVVAVAGPGLRHAEQEVARVGATWPEAQVLGGGRATAAAAHEALVGSDLVHVAAHGRHRHDNPLFSSVRMADGSLYAYEIDPGGAGREATDGGPDQPRPGRTAGCVVLSACEAGLATPRAGDETLGLGQVLLQLGTISVIAGIARVGDDVSADLMTRMHRLMVGGTDVAAALAEAQRATMEEAPVPFVSFGATW